MTEALTIKYSYEIKNSKDILSHIKSYTTKAKYCMLFWMFLSYMIDGLLFMCVLINTIDTELQIFDKITIRIVGIISMILKILEVSFRAKDRGLIAQIIRDNYLSASKLIEEKIVYLEALAINGVTKEELPILKRIKEYINSINELSSKWSFTNVLKVEKVSHIQDQLSSGLIQEEKRIQEQMQKLNE